MAKDDELEGLGWVYLVLEEFLYKPKCKPHISDREGRGEWLEAVHAPLVTLLFCFVLFCFNVSVFLYSKHSAMALDGDGDLFSYHSIANHLSGRRSAHHNWG